ncbi:MAG: hypothetical protein O3C49_02680 [Proteobacteria bacterium]|nr:hypothetical protein [Pseudomonadota bacterium]MDA1324319.1 hypothetical protein [Pseudomonadota bacterium]
MPTLTKLLAAASLIALATAGTATAADFYKGKRLSVLINYSAGGPTDVEARLFARNIARHIPGKPQVVGKNMAGAGGVVAINFLGQKAKKDGLTMGYFTALASAQAFAPLNDAGLRVDIGKFDLVATNSGSSYTYIRKDTPPGITKPEDVMKAHGLKVSGLRANSSKDILERLTMDMLGIKHGYVTGYRGSSKARVAVMQGEASLHNESQPSFRSKVIPTMIDTGMAIGLWYYPYDDGEHVWSPPALSKGLTLMSFDKFYEKVKGKKPSGMMWKAFREVNRASSMVQRSLVMPEGSPKAAHLALRKAVTALNSDPEFARDSQKTISFVPQFDVGEKAEKLTKASIQLSPDVLTFLKGYVDKVTTNKSN